MQASTKQKVYCIHCGTPVASSATECSVCLQPQPVPGAAPLPSASARYSHPQGLFSIEVPQAWQVLERNFLGIPYMQISRPDVRAQGIRGMIQQALAFGPADLQIWLLSLPPSADMNTVYQAYIELQNHMAASTGNQGAGALAELFTRPYRQEFVSFGESPGAVYDIRHSIFGLAATIERRFMTLGNTPQGLMGVVLLHQSLEHEFVQWERLLWEIATSFRFGQAVFTSESERTINHLPPLRVTEVDAALDWSWLVDLGQGNFQQAQVAAERALAECRDADTLFARAIVHQLQGEYKEALSNFESAFATTKDKGRQLIIAATAYWAERQRGDILPDGFSINFAETQQYWANSIHGIGSQWQQRCEALMQQVEAPYARIEGRFIYEVSVSLPGAFSILSGQFSASDVSSNFFYKTKAGFSQKLQAAQELGTQLIAEGIYRAIADLDAAAGKQDKDKALQLLEERIQVYSSSGNILGEAWCLLRRGDLLASPAPLGHPILFGYRLSERISDTTIAADPQLFDRSEINRKLKETRDVYNEARNQFAAAKARRGEAMALLRLAYLDVVAGKWAQAYQNYEEAKEHYKDAKGHYEEAKRRFINVGDRLNRMAADAGSIWVGLHLGEPERDLNARVKSFANEAHQHEAFAFGLSFGLAFAYAGREALATQGDVETALRAARLAQTLFEVFDARLLKMQTHGDRADALDLIQDVEASLNEREKVVGLLLLLDELKKSPDKVAGSDSRYWDIRQLGMQQTWKIVNLAIANSEYDADLLKHALDCAKEFASNVPVLPDVQAKELEKTDPMEFLRTVNIDGMSNYEQKFYQFFIYEMKRLIENGVNFFAPLSRGLKAMERRLIEDPREFDKLLSDGIQAFEAKHDADAKREFEAALQASKNNPEVNLWQAMVYAAWRKFPEALAAIRRYLAQGMPQSTTHIQNMLFQLNSQQAEIEKPEWEIRERWQLVRLLAIIKEWKDAEKQLQEIERLVGSPKGLGAKSTQDDILNYSYYGLVAEGLGKYDRAWEYLTDVKNAIEKRRHSLNQEKLRRAFGRQRPIAAVYAALARVLSKQNDWAAAFEEAERIRSRVLVEALGGSQKGAEKLKKSKLAQDYRAQLALVERLTTELAVAQRLGDNARVENLAGKEGKLPKANARLDELEADLVWTDPRWRELCAPKAEILSVTDVAARLSEGTLLLAYLFFEDHLLAWAITREGLVNHYCLNKFNNEPFVARPFGARARLWAMQWNKGDADSDIGKELAEILIKPFEDQINAASHLVIVPFAELNMFPFAALPWGDKLLGLQKSLSYLPAASLLQHFHPSDTTAKGALIVGNPTNMSYGQYDEKKKGTMKKKFCSIHFRLRGAVQ